MVFATNLGYPRIGAKRELKKATESYWKGDASLSDLQATAKELRQRHWDLQKQAGLTHIPVNDFSFYDQMLDMTATLGAVPPRYKFDGDEIDIDTYFAMARGCQRDGLDVVAMEMTKWFDTNYHYIVPEFLPDQQFRLASNKIFDEFAESKEAGINGRPVLIGPVTYLKLGKKAADFCRCSLLETLLPVYVEILQKLKEQGAEWVQIDEPALVLDLNDAWQKAYRDAYATLAKAVPGIKILLTTYFGDLDANEDLALSLPVAGLHIDLKRGPQQLDRILTKIGAGTILSLGVIDGRNIWKSDLNAAMDVLEKAAATLGKDRIFVAPSCSLLHSPNDLDLETKLDEEIKDWLAFARQKLDEIAILTKGVAEGRDAISADLAVNSAAIQSRRNSPRIHKEAVKSRVSSVTASMADRQSPFATRRKAQQAALGLPAFPTTTIGSFPQTKDIRKARAAHKKGELDTASYEAQMKAEIEGVIRYQEEIDMDVLVHGEAERNDMVEYFGEQLEGFVFTKHGWVQSYGSRYVKPPIIFGDVERPKAMTVTWSSYAQSLTKRPVKGMLTGPITILCWSFVRDDQPREDTCRQIALAIRDEVTDLEKAGIKVIQIDEPAIREGLPLRQSDWAAYLKWAVESFKLSSCGVSDETQIHTHMCYSEFNDIIDSIGALDADVISIETSRSHMELLDAFVAYKYPNEIGPGVYDIHSPRIPSASEMVGLLDKAAKVIPPDQLWVNPDCGLKTRGWAETKAALENMVKAAKTARQKLQNKAA